MVVQRFKIYLLRLGIGTYIIVDMYLLCESVGRTCRSRDLSVTPVVLMGFRLRI